MRRSTLSTMLRDATGPVHERLHRDPMLLALQKNSIQRQDYAELMRRMGGFYTVFDASLSRACDRIGPVLGAYVYHPRAPLFPEVRNCSIELPTIESLGAFAGAAYVADGAVLGGQVLSRAAGAEREHPYWDWCASHGPSVWRAANALIARADKSQREREAAVDMALAVFQAFERAVAHAPEQALP